MNEQRETIDRVCGHVVRLAGAFSLAVVGVLALVTLRSWVVNPAGAGGWTSPVLESRQMGELKASLAGDPKNEDIKRQIRRLDLVQRAEHFRREAMVVRGAWLLLAGLAVAVAAAHVLMTLRKSPHLPGKKSEESPLAGAARGRWAVGVLMVALGAGGGLLAVTSAGQLPGEFQELLTAEKALPTQPAAAAPVAAGQTRPAVPATQPPSPATQGAVATKPVAPTATKPANGGQETVVRGPEWTTLPTAEEIARNWPRFRGPGGSGVSAFTNVPLEWDVKSGKNIAWRTPIELSGTSSPIVWGDRVFLTGGVKEKRVVYCLDLAAGKILWEKAVQARPADAPPVEPEMEDTGYAAPTPVTDGRRVYALFATGELACFDFEGRLVWAQWLGTPKNDYMHATSLELHKGRLFVQLDQGHFEEKKAKLLIIDAVTGKTLRTVPRPTVEQSWTSPITISTPTGDQLITLANPWVIAYNSADGSELWRAEVLEGDGAPSPIFTNGLVIAGNTASKMAAIKPDGKGNITKDDQRIPWAIEDNIPDICSPLSDGKRVYLLTSDGFLTVWSLANGEKAWELDTEQAVSASPSLVGDKLVLLARKGACFIIPTGDQAPGDLKALRRNELGEETVACPAFVDGRIVIRTRKHVLCVAAKQ
ncbi:MAG: outer membrane biogenesis protein BamB [Planctomycetes bacterium ADurb.Bin126]|nr:MAG: outer membrane biogenesis protein BamB [Planctomycetes bacterium ADurb.Bin126]HQL73051.1 PQQ-binding-like beta-propeller repeat protein [Phycisphaerae bacterium]